MEKLAVLGRGGAVLGHGGAVLGHGGAVLSVEDWTMAKGISCFCWWLYFSSLVSQGVAGGNIGMEEVKHVMMTEEVEMGTRVEEVDVRHVRTEDVRHVKMIEPFVRGSGPAPNCGGVAVQWDQWEGRCGVCGDAWGMQVPRPHETGGEWGRGKVTNKYVQGQRINITLELTEDLGGYFNVKICPLTRDDPLESQSCLDGHSLDLSGARPTNTDAAAYWPRAGERVVSVFARLPGDLSCRRCVLQWSYYTANISATNKNKDYKMFRACADVSIVGKEVLSAGWTDWWTALFGDDEEVEPVSSTTDPFTNSGLPLVVSSSISAPISRVSLSSQGNPISPIVTSSGPEERITRLHLDPTSTEDTRGLHPKYKMSQLDNLTITVSRNVTTGAARPNIEKQSENKFREGGKYQITRHLPPITFSPTFNETKALAASRGEILNGSLKLKQTHGFYLDQKEKLTLGFNKTMTAAKKSVNSTTFSARQDKPNQTKDDSFKAKTHPNIGQLSKPTESQHDIINHISDNPVQHQVINQSTNNTIQHQVINHSTIQREVINHSSNNTIQREVINDSTSNPKPHHIMNPSTISKPNSTKSIPTVRPPDETKVTATQVNPYSVPALTVTSAGSHLEPNKTKNETESLTAAAIGISIIFILMCVGIVFILYLKKDRQLGAAKKANNSSMYDEAPTRWSEINLSLPSDYEIVPIADPDSNMVTTSSPNPPTTTRPHPPSTTHPYPSSRANLSGIQWNRSTLVSVDGLSPDYAKDGLSPDYANIPDVVPLSARSRPPGSSPNLLHHHYDDHNSRNYDHHNSPNFGDLEIPRTNPSSPRNSGERVRCQSQHISENHLDSVETYHHDNYSKSQEDVMHGETYHPDNYSRSQEDILSTGAEGAYSRSQEDILCTGAEGAPGSSSTFPPVAPAKRKKNLYSRISQRWGSEDWEKDESFLAMLAVRLTRMQSRQQITEL